MIQSPVDPLETFTTDNSSPNFQSRFPQTIVAVSREEFIEPIELTIRDKDGNKATLPNDLHGHFLVIGPSGSADSPPVAGDEQVVWVSKDGWTPLYNGDGLIYRFSFDQGRASLKSRFVKTPCYYADQATTKNENYKNNIIICNY